MTQQEIHDLVIAIAKANRHPNPEWWASRVQAAIDGTEMPEDVAPEPAPQA